MPVKNIAEYVAITLQCFHTADYQTDCMWPVNSTGPKTIG